MQTRGASTAILDVRAGRRLSRHRVRPAQRAGASAPLIAVGIAPHHLLVPMVALVSVACLRLLGVIGARAGSTPIMRPILRVTFWGVLAMTTTVEIGKSFGAAVS